MLLDFLRTRKIAGALFVTFGFKLLASIITIYELTKHAAIEIAPASAILTGIFGVIFASVIANLAWIIASVSAFYLIHHYIQDERLKHVTLFISIFIVIAVSGVDGLWDLGVLLGFESGICIMMILSVLSAATVGIGTFARGNILQTGSK